MRTSVKVAAIAGVLILLGGCSSKSANCESFNKAFDELRQAQAQAALSIINRGICHTREEAQRREKCPEYYTWMAAATNYVNFVANDKSGCTTEADRKNALADLAELAKDGAFPRS